MSLEKIKRIADLQEERDRLNREYQQKLEELVNKEVERSKKEFKEFFEEGGFEIEEDEDNIIARYKSKTYELKLLSEDSIRVIKSFAFIENEKKRYKIYLQKSRDPKVIMKTKKDNEEWLQYLIDDIKEEILNLNTRYFVYTLIRDNKELAKEKSMKELLKNFFNNIYLIN